MSREDLKDIFNHAIAAVSPEKAVHNYLKRQGNALVCNGIEYDLEKIEKVFVVGAGKGVAPMALALEDILEERLTEGIVTVKYDHSLSCQKIIVREAGHPLPDENGVLATQELINLATKAGAHDLVIALFTGGASALTPAFAGGITLPEVQTLTEQLLRCGATINEINTIRKSLSTFSGGRLAQHVAPAQLIGLIVSDVVGDDLSVIASGPTVIVPSSPSDALFILDRYGIKSAKSIREYLKSSQRNNASTKASENPIQNVLIASNDHALQAARKRAEHLGYGVEMGPSLVGEAREKAGEIIEYARTMPAGTCYLAGGETTVTIKGAGRGGRNQEMATASCLSLQESDDLYCLFAGTDGTDGPTDAAGGFACSQTLDMMVKKKINAYEYLARNDSYHFLQQTDSLFCTGPTRTNVMDLAIIIKKGA